MTSRKKRIQISLAAMIVAAACGTLAGFQLASAITVRITENRLDQYATRIVADWEASSAELRTVLAAAGAAQRRSCSSGEIAYFRALIFESEYLQDIGRMRGDTIECSAALGKLTRPAAQSNPDFTQQDGTKLYNNLTPYQNGNLTVTALQSGDLYVVFTPYSRLHLEPFPMHYTVTVTDAPTQKTGSLLGEPLAGSLPILIHEGHLRRGDALYSTRCSIRFFGCATAYTLMPDIIAANHTRFASCVALCGLSGAFFGLVLPLLYHRNKSVEQQLRRAIRNDKLRMAYQPIVDLHSRRIVGAEALMRWTDENGVEVGPDVFVRIAEQNGFVGDITKLALRHVLREFAETLRKRPDIRISMNVAGADLADPEFLPMLDSCLHRAGVSAHSLAIELTEGSTAKREIAIATIRSLRERGHAVHIDDFGTGYSSLSYLHELSVDAIKIDKSFTQAIGTESVIVAILPQILAMAEALGLGVIVEGIETPEQASYFENSATAMFAQGWLFGRPVSAGSFLRLLAAGDQKARPPIQAV
jgi:sensor c-di-GMP phosphodiesterase-like protein